MIKKIVLILSAISYSCFSMHTNTKLKLKAHNNLYFFADQNIKQIKEIGEQPREIKVIVHLPVVQKTTRTLIFKKDGIKEIKPEPGVAGGSAT